MKSTIEINESNFKTEVLESKEPVIVDFWAEWCGPCKMLAPLLDEIAAEPSIHVKVVKVNIDSNMTLATNYEIKSIPTLLYFLNGEIKDKITGVASKKTIISKLEKLQV